MIHQLGESYTINPQTNADTNVVNFEWLPRSEIKCNDCFSQNVSPFQSTLYKLRVQTRMDAQLKMKFILR